MENATFDYKFYRIPKRFFKGTSEVEKKESKIVNSNYSL